MFVIILVLFDANLRFFLEYQGTFVSFVDSLRQIAVLSIVRGRQPAGLHPDFADGQHAPVDLLEFLPEIRHGAGKKNNGRISEAPAAYGQVRGSRLRGDNHARRGERTRARPENDAVEACPRTLFRGRGDRLRRVHRRIQSSDRVSDGERRGAFRVGIVRMI